VSLPLRGPRAPRPLRPRLAAAAATGAAPAGPWMGNLRFAHRVALMPGLAAAGLLLILAVTQVLDQRTGALLTGIERGYAPALQTARDLQEALGAIQRSLQDAVAARDKSLLKEADSERLTFLAALKGAAGNAVIPAAQNQAIGRAFESYYALARQASLRLIDGGGGESLVTALRAMTTQYNDIRLTLESFTARSHRAREQAFAGARANRHLSLVSISVLTFLIVLALAALSFRVIRSLTGPLAEVVEAAERLARGDMSASIQVRSHDEIGALSLAMRQLLDYLRDMARVADAMAGGNLRSEVEPRAASDAFGHAFRTMIANLRRMLGDVKSSAVQVASTSDEISASALQIKRGAESQSAASEQTSATMVQMATQLDSVNRATQALASNVDETSSSIQQMGTSIEEVARSSERLLTSVGETAATIEQMATSIDSIAAKVNIVDEVSRQAAEAASEGSERLSGVILAIGASGKDIGKIVRIIDEIADQTNLLALNAAIEAARAGDAGRGFAVVAEEIKRLAERSMSSTREITSFVESMQTGTDEAVQLSQRILRQIVESVTRTTELVRNVQAATQEQSKGAAQIRRTTGGMHEVTQQLATAAREQALTARQIMGTAAAMNERTQQVADATSEQMRGGDQVVLAVDQIAQVAHQYLATTAQLSDATHDLALEADRLKTLSAVFEL
jgi:methyl-accepting chemotaxis protein